MICLRTEATARKLEDTKSDVLRGEMLKEGIGRASAKVRAPTPQSQRGIPAEMGMGR